MLIKVIEKHEQNTLILVYMATLVTFLISKVENEYEDFLFLNSFFVYSSISIC